LKSKLEAQEMQFNMQKQNHEKTYFTDKLIGSMSLVVDVPIKITCGFERAGLRFDWTSLKSVALS
jgi:hypothetical protein